MEEYIRLPLDTSGYGRFAMIYLNLDAEIQFQYTSNNTKKIGRIIVRRTRQIEMLDARKNYNRLLPKEDIIYRETNDRLFNLDFFQYSFTLSNSRSIFFIIGTECLFYDHEENNVLVPYS